MAVTLAELETRVLELERKVSELSTEAHGQQKLNVRLLGMMEELRDDVAIVRRHSVAVGRKIEELDGRVTSLEARLGKLEVRMEKLDARMERLEKEFSDFRRELPGIIAETMREVLRDYRR
jgi:chromosome segregation ATPase